MPAKIRLARHGRSKKPVYSIVVADARASRDGKFIEKLGNYNPHTNPATIVLDEEKAFNWLMNGAEPTDTVKAMLSYKGILFKKHLQIGVNKGAITQEAADTKYAAWKAEKEAKISAKGNSAVKAKEDLKSAAFVAETKKNEAREEMLKAKLVEAAAAKTASTEEEATSETSAEESAE